MDKTMVKIGGGKPLETGTNPDSSDLQEVKSVLGQHLRHCERSDWEKEDLRARLHAAHTREELVELWRDITGQQI